MLASFLLHGGAVLALAALHSADPPPAPQEQGVEIVWQDVPEESPPGEDATAPFAASADPTSAEEPPDEPPTEPEQELAEPPPPPSPPPAVYAEAPEPPPPEPALAEAPVPEAELPPSPIEPVPIAPPPPPEPAEARAAPAPERPRPPELPLPPPTTPAPPRPVAPRQQAQSQAAAMPRQAPPAPAAPPAAAGASRAVGSVSPPGLLDGVRNPEPEYPFVSRQRGDEGAVTVLLRISETGHVLEAEVINTSGHAALDASALRTVQRWRFRPAMRDGVPIQGSLRNVIHFGLQ